MIRCPKCKASFKPSWRERLLPSAFKGRPFIKCTACGVKITTRFGFSCLVGFIACLGMIPYLFFIESTAKDNLGVLIFGEIAYAIAWFLVLYRFVPLQAIDR